ncbi:MAG TPA: hypothetical protein VEL07_18185 [Planctomycetota bacterium]|nr:hypothetical protein [Planctomycetota bacterium]
MYGHDLYTFAHVTESLVGFYLAWLLWRIAGSRQWVRVVAGALVISCLGMLIQLMPTSATEGIGGRGAIWFNAAMIAAVFRQTLMLLGVVLILHLRVVPGTANCD